jgi:imidazolonepropionase-like amidohydrolase
MAGWRVRGIRLPDGTEVDAGVDAAGNWTAEPPAGAEPLPGRYVLPGLVDAHCHLSLAVGPGGAPVAVPAATMRANLSAARAAGITAIRDVGSPGSISLELVADGDGTGLAVSGRFLAPAHQFFPHLHEPVPADDLVAAALAEVDAGARWVKLVGDFPTLRPDTAPEPPSPTYPIADVRRLVEAVHAAGARVAAHTTTRFATELIAAGIDSVEHGPDMVESDLDALAARGGAWTPTLGALFAGDDPDRERWRQEQRERLGALLPLAVRRGVTVMTGSDVIGTVPGEVALLTELGLAPAEALAAATTAARRYLGFPDLRPGRPADVVTYAHDPRDDPAVLARPAAVLAGATRLR